MIYPIHRIEDSNFEQSALEVFRYQYTSNAIYQKYCDTLKKEVSSVHSILDIPFLPISFFKTHRVISGIDSLDVMYFESSGTGSEVLSAHYIKSIEQYHTSIELGFRHFFGNKGEYTVVGLLPHYMERPHSSLVYMVRHWMQMRGQTEELFYLYNLEDLKTKLEEVLGQGKPVLLIGISFALLDFAEQYAISNSNLIIIETGGMKGRRKEVTKSELIYRLQRSYPKSRIISEYGMCELLSQAYSDETMLFSTPPWMKVLISDVNDPLTLSYQGTGVANIIDLANIDSCAFIQTQDLIRLEDTKFQILGRVDHSDIRGCSLLYS